jgi:hypothetical protein
MISVVSPPQVGDLANSLWAYATMGRPPAAPLLARIDEHVVRKLGELNALDVARATPRATRSLSV